LIDGLAVRKEGGLVNFFSMWWLVLIRLLVFVCFSDIDCLVLAREEGAAADFDTAVTQWCVYKWI